MNDKNRMLLHWVNSLPLTTCLLVDDLLDLRFGNELVDIARWVEVTDCWSSCIGLLAGLLTMC